jgi:hypothetical protein
MPAPVVAVGPSAVVLTRTAFRPSLFFDTGSRAVRVPGCRCCPSWKPVFGTAHRQTPKPAGLISWPSFCGNLGSSVKNDRLRDRTGKPTVPIRLTEAKGSGRVNRRIGTRTWTEGPGPRNEGKPHILLQAKEMRRTVPDASRKKGSIFSSPPENPVQRRRLQKNGASSTCLAGL